MSEDVTISYRGAGYELGRGRNFYGIWAAGAPRAQPLEWWPETPEGWAAAWGRFTGIEAPGTIAAVVQASPAKARGIRWAGTQTRPVVAAGLLALGVVAGFVGLFPSYVGGSSLASSAGELVPHLMYLAAWGAGAALIMLGGTRAKAGAMVAAGASLVTLGLFFSDLGEVISGVTAGTGLWLGLIGWLACAAGSAVAVARLRPEGKLGSAQGQAASPALMVALAAVAAIGAAVTFVPSWDSYTLHSAAGVSRTVTAGYAFANPGAVIAGNVMVIVALVAVAILAALWRPQRLGAALLAGAIVPMAAQGISALILLGQSTPPAQFGIPAAEASALGLTISNGVTATFWIYCIFVFALIGTFAQMLVRPRPAGPAWGGPVQGVPGYQPAAVSHLAPMTAAVPAGAGAPVAGAPMAGPPGSSPAGAAASAPAPAPPTPAPAPPAPSPVPPAPPAPEAPAAETAAGPANPADGATDPGGSGTDPS